MDREQLVHFIGFLLLVIVNGVDMFYSIDHEVFSGGITWYIFASILIIINKQKKVDEYCTYIRFLYYAIQNEQEAEKVRKAIMEE